MNYIQTNDGVTVILESGIHTILRTNPVFKSLKQAILNKNEEDVVKNLSIAEALKNYSGGIFELRDGLMYANGKAAPEVLNVTVTRFMNEGLDFSPLVKFWNNLSQNPSQRALNCLYNFLSANNIAITSDGCFLAYKKVRDDYKDIYSGKFDNSPGKTPEVDRSQVDDDPNRTCSRGLHVCAFSYLSNYGTWGANKVVLVKVNPKDVVAVPTDYNNAKMRVCKYHVLEEYIRDGELTDSLVVLPEESVEQTKEYQYLPDEYKEMVDDGEVDLDEAYDMWEADLQYSYENDIDEEEEEEEVEEGLPSTFNIDKSGRIHIGSDVINYMFLLDEALYVSVTSDDGLLLSIVSPDGDHFGPLARQKDGSVRLPKSIVSEVFDVKNGGYVSATYLNGEILLS